MLWVESLIPKNRFTRPGTKRGSTRNTIWHYTANPGASARNHVIYFGQTLPKQNEEYIRLYGEGEARRRQLIREASAHIFIDRVESLLLVPLDEIAYHASQANSYSVGVELCIEKDGSLHPDTLARAVQVGRDLAHMYNQSPSTDFLRHYDITSKNCPAFWVSNPAGWKEFKEAVARKGKLKMDDAVVDYILAVMGHYWKNMEGNEDVQNYTHFCANQLREAVGREPENG